MQGPLRVLYVEAPPLAYGSSLSLLALMSALDRDKVQPVLACNRHNDLLDMAAEIGVETLPLPLPGVPKESVAIGEKRRGALRAMSDGLLTPLRRLRDRRQYAEVIGCIEAAVAERDIDILHLNNQPSTNRFGYYADVGIPIVQHVRDAPQTRSAHVRALVGKAARLIAISDHVAADAREAFGVANVERIYNPVSEHIAFKPDARARWREKWGVGEDDFVFGELGRFVRWKGQDLAIEAFLANCGDEAFARRARLVLVGSSADTSSYEAACKQMAGSDAAGRIIFEPFSNDVAGVLSAFDTALHPVRKPEAFGRVLVEAMACGAPPLARGLGAVPELVTHGETGLIHDDQDGLIAHMRQVFDAPELCAAMRAAGAERARQFSPRPIAEQVERLYAEVAGRDR